MLLKEMGEKKILRRLLPQLPVHHRFINGFGHDASAVELEASCAQVLVTKIDRAAQPMATRRGWADYRLWGRLAVTATCSDLLAAGATPQAFMLALVLPGDFDYSALEQIVLGCSEECERRDVAFVGGDTKEGADAQVIGSGFGTAPRDRLNGRTGARTGDVVVLAGPLGGYLGAFLSMAEVSDTRCADWPAWCAYVSHPVARWAEAGLVNRHGDVTSAMDASDGLFDMMRTLGGPCGIRIDEARIPYHPFALDFAERHALSPLPLAFGVGDWNIMYTMSPKAWEMISSKAAGEGLQLSRVGEVTPEPGVRILTREGDERCLKPIVNEHFASRQEDEGSYIDRITRGDIFET